MLNASEQIAGETIKEGDRIRVYVVEVRRGGKGPQIMLSRTHPGLVKRLFELEVPEIADGTVTVQSMAQGRPCGGHRQRAEGRKDRHYQIQ